MRTSRAGLVILIAVITGAATVIIWLCATPKLNLVLITLDTTRADHLGCYGYAKARTPSLDRLAAEGVTFEQAFTCAPLTLPAHATMFTGLLPPEHGIRINGENALDTSVPVLAEILAKNGYRTAAFVASKVLASDFGLNRGFDTYNEQEKEQDPLMSSRFQIVRPDPEDTPYRPANEIADAALTWLQDIVTTNKGSALIAKRRPFFCWLHFYDPHLPRHFHKELLGDSFDSDYDAEIAFIDLHISRLLAFLEAQGLRRNTLIVAVGDHGEGLGEKEEIAHGFMLYSTLHVPMIFSLPSEISSGIRTKTEVSLVDLMPTLLDVLRARPQVYGARTDPRNIQLGKTLHRSLAATLKKGDMPSRACYSETLLPYSNFGWAPLHGLINDRWKYIRAPRPELYARRSDPKDKDNVASKYPTQLEEMESLLSQMEGNMLSGSAPSLQLSAEKIRQLASLGYLAGGQKNPPPKDITGMVDMKDMSPVIDLQGQALARMQAGDLGPETWRLCSEIIRLSPRTAVFHAWGGIVLSAQGKIDLAQASFEEALRLSPDIAMVHNALGILLVQQGKAEKALAHFKRALEARPSDKTVLGNLSLIHSQLGLSYGRAGDYQKAVSHLHAAIEANPDMADAHNNLGIAYMAQGKARDAIAHFETAIRIKPDYPIAQVNLSKARRSLSLNRGTPIDNQRISVPTSKNQSEEMPIEENKTP